LKPDEESYANLADDATDFRRRYPGESFELKCPQSMSIVCPNCSATVTCSLNIDSNTGVFDMLWNVTEEQKLYCQGNVAHPVLLV